MIAERFASVQGNVLRGYSMPMVAHVFGQVADADVPRWKGFFAELAPSITPSEWKLKPKTTLNLGIGYRALAKLFPAASAPLAELFPAFAAGMSRRRAELGDPDGDLWRIWHRRDVWLSIHGSDERQIEARIDALRALASDLRLETEVSWGAALERDGHHFEHFGFRDDISYPAVEGFPTPDDEVPGRGKRAADGSWQRIATGEFLLGYADERGRNRLEGLPPGLRQLLHNGTFAVFRKLRQDVGAFRDFVESVARSRGEPADTVASRLVGRCANGDSLVAPGRDSDFDYADDPQGARCPVGSHVRRSNPRTSGEHRMIRRGMPYGRPFEPSQPNDVERGMYFVALNASIEEQFEFVQALWLNQSAGSLRNSRDPLVGVGAGPRRMLIEGDVGERRAPALLLAIPDFVTTLGGEYYFMPSIEAVRTLAAGPAGGFE